MAKDKRTHRESLLIRLNIILATAIVVVCFGIAVKESRLQNQIEPAELQIPDWIVQDFLDPNPYSRPQDPLTEVKNIVVHYVGNAGTNEKQNRAYFNNMPLLPEKERKSVSSHFIIGIDGTILQCIPLGEIAYANGPRNYDTISIECCHPDKSGEFSEATKESLRRLAKWLCNEFDLSEKQIIRHYDVSGKDCPTYYVEHKDEWKKLRKEIWNYGK